MFPQNQQMPGFPSAAPYQGQTPYVQQPAAQPNWQPANLPNFPAPPAQAKPPAPVARAYAPETPAPQTLVLPAPGQLGIAPPSQQAVASASGQPGFAPPSQFGVAPAPAFNWNAAHDRLRQLGQVGFYLNKDGQGGFRVLCVMQQGVHLQSVEGTGSSEAAALTQAVARAESWHATLPR